MKKAALCVLVVATVAMAAIGVASCTATSEPVKPKAAGPDWDGTQPKSKCVNPGNKVFYNADGSFNMKATKEAYFELMRAHGYPIPAMLKGEKGLWVCDFLSRDNEKMGMGGVFWINESAVYAESGAKAYDGKFKDAKFGYLGHDIYLLPGQSVPEHRHVGGNEDHGPKMEAWHIRHGEVEFFGEHDCGTGETLISDMPEKDRPWGYGQKWFKAKYVSKRKAGEIYQLKDPESWHFMRAGKNGAIVTEYATFHNQVEFSNPKAEFKCSEAKE